MTITAPNPPAPADRVIELLSEGTTATRTAELTGWPRNRIVALVNGRKGWLLSPATDTVYCPADADPIEDPGAADKPEIRITPAPVDPPEDEHGRLQPGRQPYDDVPVLLMRAEGIEGDKAIDKAYARVQGELDRLREALSAHDDRARQEAEKQQAIDEIAAAERRLAEAKARARELGATGRRAAKPVKEAQLGRTGGPTTAEIRAWAAAEGIEIAPRGRIPQPVREQYDQAHAGGTP